MKSRPRQEFTDAQKAHIFVRDGGVCSYSGKNLWLLDYGTTPFWDIDWVDHLQPWSKGGETTVENGVCAARQFNLKKRHHRHAFPLLFHAGQPTSFYRSYFGIPPSPIPQWLARHTRFSPVDWYFNRCLYNVFLGLHFRCERIYLDKHPQRDDHHWFKAAWKRLQQFQRLSQVPHALPLERRALLGPPESPESRHLLALRSCQTWSRFQQQLERLNLFYTANYAFVHQLSRDPTVAVPHSAWVNPILWQWRAHYFPSDAVPLARQK